MTYETVRQLEARALNRLRAVGLPGAAALLSQDADDEADALDDEEDWTWDDDADELDKWDA